MRGSKTLLVIAVTLLAVTPMAAGSSVTNAQAETYTATVDLVGGLGGATVYSHNDCVGPGLPGTAPAHTTHTQTAGGLVFNGRIIRFSVVGLTIAGAGICPVTAVGGPVLPQDFTGTWHMTAKCGAGTLNPGATFLDWEVQFVAGIVVGSGSGGVSCSGYFGNAWSIDVTIEISDVTYLGVQLPATGGILLTITQ